MPAAREATAFGVGTAEVDDDDDGRAPRALVLAHHHRTPVRAVAGQCTERIGSPSRYSRTPRVSSTPPEATWARSDGVRVSPTTIGQRVGSRAGCDVDRLGKGHAIRRRQRARPSGAAVTTSTRSRSARRVGSG